MKCPHIQYTPNKKRIINQYNININQERRVFKRKNNLVKALNRSLANNVYI